MSEVKSKRFVARVSPGTDSVIRAAADARGISASSFVIESALLRAQMDMADRSNVSLAQEDWNAFCAALDEPATVNKRLADAIRRAAAQ